MATVAAIISQVKWQADKQRGGRIDATDLVPLANRAYKEAWDVIVASGEDYFIRTSSEFTLTGGPSSFSRVISETDFYKIKAVQPKCQDQWGEPLLPYVPGRLGVTYRLEGSTLYFEPQDYCAGTYRYRYHYQPADLTLVTDPIQDVNGWIEAYMVDAMVARIRDREEEDPNFIASLQQDLAQRIQRMAAHRAGPRRVADVRRRPRPRHHWEP